MSRDDRLFVTAVRALADDSELLEVGSQAVMDALTEWADSGTSLFVASVVKLKPTKTVKASLQIALKAIADTLEATD